MDNLQAYRILVRDLMIYAEIGVHAHEKGRKQRVRINIELDARRSSDADEIDAVVSYERIVERVHGLVERGHIHLLESLGEAIADLCLSDERVSKATVRVEKLRIFADTEAVGVEITRFRDDEPEPPIER